MENTNKNKQKKDYKSLTLSELQAEIRNLNDLLLACNARLFFLKNDIETQLKEKLK